MPKGYAYLHGQAIELSRSNFQTFEDGVQRTYKAAYAAKDGVWHQFIYYTPLPGTVVSGLVSGVKVHMNGQTVTAFVPILSPISSYDLAAIRAESGSVKLRIARQVMGDTVRNISFSFIFKTSQGDIASELTDEGETITVNIPKKALTGTIGVTWGDYSGGTRNTGWCPTLSSTFKLTF
jgi:hypothetical protein